MDCQNSSLLVTVLCCLTALLHRTLSLGVWGGPLLEVLPQSCTSCCRYCHLARSSSYSAALVFTRPLLAPATLSVSISLSLTVPGSRWGCLRISSKLGRSRFRLSHCWTVPSHGMLCSMAAVSAGDCLSGLALASLVVSPWWTVFWSPHQLYRKLTPVNCPIITFHLVSIGRILPINSKIFDCHPRRIVRDCRPYRFAPVSQTI